MRYLRDGCDMAILGQAYPAAISRLAHILTLRDVKLEYINGGRNVKYPEIAMFNIKLLHPFIGYIYEPEYPANL